MPPCSLMLSVSRSVTGRSVTGPIYAAIGVGLDGNREILGLWVGDDDRESAKFWMSALTEPKNRGTKDVFFVARDSLKGLPENARYRRAVKARGHFPTVQVVLKCPYLVTRSPDPKGTRKTK